MDETEIENARNGSRTAPADLKPWVAAFWGRAVRDAPRHYHIFPSGRSELFFNFGDHATSASLESPLGRLGAASIFVPRYRPYLHRTGAKTDWFLIQLTPLGVRTIIGCPTAALPDRDIPLCDAQPVPGDLIDALAKARSFDRRCDLASGWLRGRAQNRKSDTGSEPVSRIVEALRSGQIEHLRSIAGVLDLSERQARNRFRREIGVSPKQLQMLLRVERTWSTLYNGLPRNLCAEGYTDDSHFSRDFHRFTGIRPSAYMAAKAAGDRLINGVTIG